MYAETNEDSLAEVEEGDHHKRGKRHIKKGHVHNIPDIVAWAKRISAAGFKKAAPRRHEGRY